jgi:hypothetical protein
MIDSEKRDAQLAEMLEYLLDLPEAEQVRAFERLIVAVATVVRDGSRLRQFFKGIDELPLAGSSPELAAFRLKLRGALEAAQDDSALAAAITTGFAK